MKLCNVIRAGVASAFIGATVLAQQPNPNQPNQAQPGQVRPQADTGLTKPPPGKNKHGHMHLNNDVIAACLAIENQEEIRLAQFAMDKTKSEEVKKFASMLIEEHTQTLEALRQVAPNNANVSNTKDSPQRAGTANEGAAKENATRENAPRDDVQRVDEPNENKADEKDRSGEPNDRNRPAASHQSQVGVEGSGLDMIQLHRELSEQCLNDTKEMLMQKSDGDFDKYFVGMQFVKHAGMQSKLTVLQRHVSGELKNVVSQALETTKKHMKHAEDLMGRLDGTPANETGSERRRTEKE